MNTSSFDEAYNKALVAIDNLRTEAEALKENLDTIIDACDEIDNAL